MQLNFAQKISLGFFILFVAFWLALFASGTTAGFYNYLFSFCMCIIPLYGGAIAMISAERWHGLKGFVGKGIFFLGLGLVCWGAGELVWSFYNFFVGVAAPYPSIADIGFAPSVFFYAAGTIYLLRAAGADTGLRQKYAKPFMLLVPVVMFAICYYLLVVVARGGVLLSTGSSWLKSVLDIAYPLGDFISLTLSVVISGLSFRYLTKEYRLGVTMLLFGIAAMFAADMIFSYTTTRGTYFNADFGDLVFTIGTFLLAFGVLAFCNPSYMQKEGSASVPQ
jgi:hypothetical protein